MSKTPSRRHPPLALLGGLSAADFLRDYWQKQPLLVRQAIPQFGGLIDAAGLRKLAARDGVQSRLVVRSGRQWTLEQGPFPPRRWRTLAPDSPWTLLVQELNFHLTAADDLLARFRFIPHARIDDVMVSLACPGGGVGPHFDSYDVFLLQGPGRRRWRISAQPDAEPRPGVPLRLLRNFRPEQSWVLEPGDLLYLPPRYAHEGTAVDECFTYSIGCRAPSPQEWVSEYLMDVAEQLRLPGQYADPDPGIPRHPGALPAAMPRFFARELGRLRFDRASIRDFSGRYLTEPKPHVFFDPPGDAPTQAAFRRQALARGVRLDPRTRLLFLGEQAWCNGEAYAIAAVERNAVVALADQRRLEAAALQAGAAAAADGWRKSLWPMLHQWYCDGWLQFALAATQRTAVP